MHAIKPETISRFFIAFPASLSNPEPSRARHRDSASYVHSHTYIHNDPDRDIHGDSDRNTNAHPYTDSCASRTPRIDCLHRRASSRNYFTGTHAKSP